MLEIFKEFWFKRKARIYRALVIKMTSARSKIKVKQEVYTQKAEEYAEKYKTVSKL